MGKDSPSSDNYLNSHCNHLRGDLMHGAVKKHPERSEESEYMLTGAYQILRFAQDDIMMKTYRLCLFYNRHFVDEVTAIAQLVDDEEDVADVYCDTTLQVVVEVDVATERFPVAVEGTTNQFAIAIDNR